MAKYFATQGPDLVEMRIWGDEDVTEDLIKALRPYFWDGEHTAEAGGSLYFYCSTMRVDEVMQIVQSFNEVTP